MRALPAILAAAIGLAACEGCRDKPKPVAATPAPPPAATPAPAPQPPPPVTVSISTVRGDVSLRRGSTGPWTPAKPGDRLDLDDAVRTGTAATARLGIGPDASIEIRERTEIAVRQLLANRARFRLERGRVGASTGKSGLGVAVEASGSSAVAEAAGGSFAVFNDGNGLVAVVAEAGEVKLSSNGGDAVLAAGEGVRVVGTAPPQREQLPPAVLLKVAWPEEKLTRKTSVTVRGVADQGAAVVVNGKPATVLADGTFEAQVPLGPGVNQISVDSTDRFGRTASAAETVQVDRKPPKVKAQSEGWQ